MEYFSRPWGKRLQHNEIGFLLSDSLNGEASNVAPQSVPDRVPVLYSEPSSFVLLPYPKKGRSQTLGIEGFPVRHRGQPLETELDQRSFELTGEMNKLIARVQELEEALDDPANVWQRLRQAWRNAEDDNKPRMSEIVRQASFINSYLKDLEKKIRRILRREREKTQLDRVQEMDRASLRWISRQPGKTLAQRAGADQRIMAIIRKENFDTLENRVVHSYSILAERVARTWLDNHPKAKSTSRYKRVDKLRKTTRNFARELKKYGVGTTTADFAPNYVLMQDRNYKGVYCAWLRLIRQDHELDDLWSWQGQTWIDFCALAIVLSLNDLAEAELVAQSPIVWNHTGLQGRFFETHQPLAIFWLRETGLVVEVMVRPDGRKINQLTRSVVTMKITEQVGDGLAREILVWTPHNFDRSDFDEDAQNAADLIHPIPSNLANVERGLILIPSHGDYQHSVSRKGNKQVDLVAFAPSGNALGKGMKKIADILKSQNR
jgi:hypothetical protein